MCLRGPWVIMLIDASGEWNESGRKPGLKRQTHPSFRDLDPGAHHDKHIHRGESFSDVAKKKLRQFIYLEFNDNQFSNILYMLDLLFNTVSKDF